MLEQQPSRRPSTFGGMVYLLVVAMAIVGLVITAAGAWRTGVSWLGVGLLIGAGFRAVLTERGAGMLRVRRRISDVVMLAAGGTTLLLLAITIPNQPS